MLLDISKAQCSLLACTTLANMTPLCQLASSHSAWDPHLLLLWYGLLQRAEEQQEAGRQDADGAEAAGEGAEDFSARMRSAAVAKRKAMEPSPLVCTLPGVTQA